MLFTVLTAFALAQDAVPPHTSTTSLESDSGWQIKNETEVSLVVADGNTESETYVIKQNNQFKRDRDIILFKGLYLQTKSNDVKTGESWMYSPRYERELSDVFNIFVAYTEESDKFAGYDRRRSGDIGGKFFFKKVEGVEELFAELNYRTTREKDVLGTSDTLDYGRLYTEWNRKWTPTISSKLWVEYLQNIDESEDYKINYEPSIAVVMTEILSLKLAYLSKYENTPPAGAEKRDNLYTTSIVANF